MELLFIAQQTVSFSMPCRHVIMLKSIKINIFYILQQFYNIIGTVLPSDSQMFYYPNTPIVQSQSQSYLTTFTPTFTNQLFASTSAAALAALNTTCSGSLQCMSDSLLTGLPQFGLSTMNFQASIALQNSLQSKFRHI